MLNKLPSDIVHEILLMIDTRQDLSSVVSSCSYIHNVFKVHPNSILRYVVANEVGMIPAVLPYAWRALYALKRSEAIPTMFPLPPISQSSVYSVGLSVATWPAYSASAPGFAHTKLSDMGEELTVSTPNMGAVVAYLHGQYDAVSDTAKGYCVRYKESAKVYDSMDYEEARRFYTGAYLFWEYQAFFFNPPEPVNVNNILGADYGNEDDEDNDDSEYDDDMDDDDSDDSDYNGNDDDDDAEDEDDDQDDQPEDEDEAQKRRKASESRRRDTIEQFLTDLPVKELSWMYQYKEFLMAEVDHHSQFFPFPWPSLITLNPSYPPLNEEHMKHHLFIAGPKYYRKWQQYWYPNDDRCHHCTDILCMSDILSAVMRRRGLGKQSLEQPEFKILRQRGLIIDKCQKCDGPPNFNTGLFYNVTSLLENSLIWLPRQLPGSLSSNPVETKEMDNRLANALIPAIAQTDPPSSQIAYKLQQSGRSTASYQVVKEIMQHATIRAEQSLAASRVNRSSSHHLNLSDDEDEDEAEDDTGASTGANTSSSSGNNQGGNGDKPKEPKKPKEYRWSPHDLLCQNCFQPLLVQFYYDWWLDERQTNRVNRTYQNSFTGDCWWGTDCRTQRVTKHAQKLNHCCPKTR